MARPLRIEFAGALYHVTSPGDRREAIYEDDEDREAFLGVLAEVVERFNWISHAYCLMTNHYHLLVETVEGSLSKGMRHLNGVYTQASNRRHKRVGHLFQGRYKGIVVDRDAYLQELSRYVVLRRLPEKKIPDCAGFLFGFKARQQAHSKLCHCWRNAEVEQKDQQDGIFFDRNRLNPVRAGGMLASSGDWPWSSYRATAGEAPVPKWLVVDALLCEFGSKRKQARLRYQRFVREGIEQRGCWEGLRQQIYLGDEKFVERMQSKAQVRGDELTVPRVQRRPKAPSLEIIAAHHGERNAAIVAAYATGAYSYRETASYFGVHLATVGRIVRGAMQQCEN